MVALVGHDDTSRRRLAISNPVAARTDLSQFTHRAAISIPTARPLTVIVYGTDWDGDEVIIGCAVVHPTWATRRVALAADHLGVLQERYAQHRTVRALGIPPEHAPATPREAVALDDLLDQATTIAQTMVYGHPAIMSMDAEASKLTHNIVDSTPLLDGLVNAVTTFLDNVGVYGAMVPMINADGGQQTLTWKGTETPASSLQPFVTDNTVYKGQPISNDWTSALRQTATQAVSAVLSQVQDTIDLEGKSWIQTTGTAPTTQPVSATPPDPDPGPEPTTTTTTTVPPPTAQWSIDETWIWGTKMHVQAIGTTTVPGENNQTYTVPQITVRTYNNNEKVYGFYAEYFDSDQKQQTPVGGPQVSTSNPVDLAEQFSALLYAAPTFLGIPFFAQNYLDYVVTFPPLATEADLMLATMGRMSGWQDVLQDASGNQLYPGAVFPAECKLPVIWTTCMNLAVPTLMLALDVAATATLFQGCDGHDQHHGQGAAPEPDHRILREDPPHPRRHRGVQAAGGHRPRRRLQRPEQAVDRRHRPRARSHTHRVAVNPPPRARSWAPSRRRLPCSRRTRPFRSSVR